ncbi:MAG: acetyl-CoA carboxylase biotin carboxyl carrier protein [Lachnospirales bacterium]
MNLNEVLKLIDKIEKSAFSDFKIDFDGLELELKKEGKVSKKATQQVETIKEETYEEVAVEDTFVPKEDLSGLKKIVSPIVGVYYSKPAPDKDDFVKVGDKVKKGDVLCIIEAMKVLNEIKSDCDGEVYKIEIENEAVVEHSQVIMYIK